MPAYSLGAFERLLGTFSYVSVLFRKYWLPTTSDFFCEWKSKVRFNIPQSLYFMHIYVTPHIYLIFILPWPPSLWLSPFDPIIISCLVIWHKSFLWLLHHISANSYHATLTLHYTPQREGYDPHTHFPTDLWWGQTTRLMNLFISWHQKLNAFCYPKPEALQENVSVGSPW